MGNIQHPTLNTQHPMDLADGRRASRQDARRIKQLRIAGIIGCWVLNVGCWMLPTAARANALTAPAQPAETLPANAQIAALSVSPERVVLAGKVESAQLVITARLASGENLDVTRIAKLTPSGSASVSPAGRVTPNQDGEGAIRIELAGQTSSVPVSVSGIGHAQPVDFIRDVNPVMTKLGCNQGTCHGAKDGKVGFKLSLRGYDPLFDVRSLKDDLAGRRLNAAQPDDSLMLLKATAGVPHEGGQRTQVGEKYYNILRDWIADGARLDLAAPRVTKIEIFPRDPVVQQIGTRQQVRVVATYTDGKMRDVTAEAFVDSGNGDVAKTDDTGLVETLRRGEAPLLARYEGAYAATTITVMGQRDGFVWQQPETWGRADELVAAKWQRMKIAPSGLCSDTDFLRRVYLDLTGLPPSAEDVRAFAADTRPVREKRDAVVSRLIGSAEFVEHWTNRWADLLQVNSKFLGKEGAAKFREWIKGEVAANTPYDQFSRKILTATGSNRENPAASYWKILREPTETMENTTHLFLATRFNCNKCHDHPFERWTQDQYYHLGAFFAQVGFEKDPASGKSVIVGTAVEKAKPLWEIVKDQPTGEFLHLRTNKNAEPSFPFPAQSTPTGTRREQLASWITSADNRYFAASYVNRLWGYLLGTGIIEPLDDIRAGNPPSNPELLEHLTKEFIGSGFNVRHILHLICTSRTYQLSLATNRWNDDDKTNYSHALARRLPAEVLYDAVLKVTGANTKLPGGSRATTLPDSALDLPSGFLANLGRPARESSCECERSSDLRLGAVMALLGGPAVADAIGDANNALAKTVAAQPDDAKLVDEIFHRILSRPATPAEIEKARAAWAQINADHAALEAQLKNKEAEQAPLIAKAEADRNTAIEAAKTELARYENELGPKVAEAEKKRAADLAAAETAVKDYTEKNLTAAQMVFENTIPAARTHTGWFPVDVIEARSTGEQKLDKQPDGSLKASGPVPSTANYVVKFDSKLAGVTGVLLEVMPDATSPQFGPGLFSDGNFVLGEIEVKTGPFGSASGTDPAEFSGAVADFSQDRFEVSKAINGKRGDENDGWAISKKPGVPHFAAFAFKKPLSNANGLRYRVEMNLPRKNGFGIGRFRLWLTTSAQPLNIGLPAPVAEALKKPAPTRTKEDTAALTAYWNTADPELLKLRLSAGKLALPLPTDPGILQRRAAIAKAEEPIKLDAQLLQFRQDAEQSRVQSANVRLTGAQDLAWALINSAAFLFNR